MDRKLASDLFCSLLMANHIMSGNQILSTISRAGIETIESFWKSHVNLMNADNLSPDQIDRFEKFRESEVYTKFETYVDYVSGHGIGRILPICRWFYITREISHSLMRRSHVYVS